VRAVGGRDHVCLEEGTQSAWLYELLKPHVAEVVVAVSLIVLLEGVAPVS